MNGTNDYATAENVNVGSELTVAAWLCSSNLVGEHAILGEATGYTLKTSGASLRFTTPGIKDHVYAANFVTGQWTHVVVTFQAGVSNGCKFYINGQFRAATNASAKNVTANATWIGRNQWGQYFSGLLDDIRIYRAALSASEIANLYANHAPVFVANPMVLPGAAADANYVGETLAERATDSDSADLLHFRKIAGPDWLTLSSSGLLSGTPADTNVGTNEFLVQVADNQDAVDSATVRVVVAYQPTMRLSLAIASNDQFAVSFTGEPQQNYQLLGSTNLVLWTPLVILQTDILGRANKLYSIAHTNAFFLRIQQ